MHSLRWSPMVAALGIAIAGCSSSQTSGPATTGASSSVQKQKSPEEKFADIKLQFNSLTPAEKAGAKGQKLMADLMAIKDGISEQATVEIARMVGELDHAKSEAAKNDGPELPAFDPKLPGVGIDPKNFDPKKFPERKNPKDLPKLPELKLPNAPPVPDAPKIP